MGPEARLADDLRLVRDLDDETPALQAVFERLAAADDEAVAELYPPERETYFSG